MSFLIDSGSPINTLTKEDFEKLLNEGATLYDVKYDVGKKFTGYGSTDALICTAKLVAKVYISNLKPESFEQFYVIENVRQSLLGKSTSERLYILKVGLAVNKIEESLEFPKIPNLKIKLIIDKRVDPKQKTYNCIPLAQEKRVTEILDRMEKEGIIEKVKGYSEWISPLIVVPKGINDIRVCVDMREPNTAIKRVVYPLPTLEFILCKLKNCGIFSKIDIKSAYHHIELHEESRYITAFLSQNGVMQFRRLTFGLNSAPEIFQRIMSQLIQGIEGAFCFLDDIIVAGESREQHDMRLENVLKVLRQNNLTLNREKCKFGLTQIDFLGSTITKNTVRPSQEKIKAVKEFVKPKSVEEVRSFIGLVNYLGKFIPHLATKCEPLNEIVRDKVMKWDVAQQHSFESLKKDLCTCVLELGIFDPRNQTIVYTDASPTGLGAALVQIDNKVSRVIEFAAKTLTQTERRYPQAQREALAAVWAVERFHYYLSGLKFTLLSDYRALQFIFKGAFRINKRAISRAESWALRLQHYDFDIKYIPGKDNIADPLSRLYEGNDEAFHDQSEIFVCNINLESEVISLKDIAEETAKDEELVRVMEALNNECWDNVLPKYRAMKWELSCIDGVLYKDYQVIVPSSLSKKALDYAHKGHSGEVTMKRLLRERVWWPNITKDIHNKVKRCMGCALVARPNPPAPLTRKKIPEEAWHDIAVDFFSAGTLGELFVVIDYYSRYAIVREMKTTDADVTIKCLRDIFKTFGNPVTLKSDNGPPFASSKFIEYCKSQNIELVKIPPHQPQCNGLVERFNKNLKRILQIGNVMKENLGKTLEEFVEIYNKRPCSVTNLSPFEMMMKRKPRTILPLGVLNSYWTEADARERDAVEKLKGKLYADKKRSSKVIDIKVGDFVMMKDLLPGNKLKTKFLNKKFRVIDKQKNELTLKDENGLIYKRHIDHTKEWPEDEVGEEENNNLQTENPTPMETNYSPKRKRNIKKPIRYL